MRSWSSSLSSRTVCSVRSYHSKSPNIPVRLPNLLIKLRHRDSLVTGPVHCSLRQAGSRLCWKYWGNILRYLVGVSQVVFSPCPVSLLTSSFTPGYINVWFTNLHWLGDCSFSALEYLMKLQSSGLRVSGHFPLTIMTDRTKFKYFNQWKWSSSTDSFLTIYFLLFVSQ